MNDYINVDSSDEENEQQQLRLRFPPKNSKRDKKRYKRNIKRLRRTYFKECVENNTFLNDEFLETIHSWYFK